MIMQDRLEEERNDAKNNVEEYVYDMRNKLHGMLEKFVKEAVSQPSTFLFFKICDIWADDTFNLSELIGAACVLHRTEMLYH